MTILEIALAYLEKGYSVIPIKSRKTIKRSISFKEKLDNALMENTKNPNPREKNEIIKELVDRECKKPLLRGWKEYQTRLPTEEEVNSWFTLNPDANIAIVTGKLSNVVVFDADSPEAIQFIEEQGGFPENTPMANSAKGHHYYVKHPGFHAPNQVKKNVENIDEKLDLDVRGDGGYIMVEPSIHGSGYEYHWLKDRSILDLEPIECDPWMIQYLKKVKLAHEKTKERPKKEVNDTPQKQEASRVVNQPALEKNDFASILANGSAQGERNDTATRLLGHLLKANPKDDAWEIINQWNTKNKPPLDEDELKGIFNSIAKAEENSKATKEKETTISIEKFLDNPNSVLAEYNQNYVRVPFAYNNDLDNFQSLLNGGLAGGNLYILGGIPSSGKTGLLNCIGDNICLQGFPVLYFSYDDGKSELRYRTFARFSEYDIEAFNVRTIPEFQKIFAIPTIKQIMPLKYVIQEMISVEKWPDLVAQIIKKHGKGPVIMIDYLRKLKLDNGSGDERLRVDTIMGKLTELAKDKNIPIITISELARDSYKGGQRLSMASFKESGSIEYEASWLGILAAVEEVGGENGDKEFKMKQNWENIIEHDGNIDLIVFKAKRGTGSTGKIPLKIDKNKMTATDRKDDDPTLPQDASAYQPPKKVKKSRY